MHSHLADEVTDVVIIIDRNPCLSQDRARVKAARHAMYRKADLGITIAKCPLDSAGTAVFRKQARVHVDCAETRHSQDFVRDQPRKAARDDEVRGQRIDHCRQSAGVIGDDYINLGWYRCYHFKVAVTAPPGWAGGGDNTDDAMASRPHRGV